MKQNLISTLMIFTIVVAATAQKTIDVEERHKSPGGGAKWAVLIGVNGYIDPQISPLKYAVNDAQKLYELLIDPNYGGFEVGKVKLLTDDADKKLTDGRGGEADPREYFTGSQRAWKRPTRRHNLHLLLWTRD